jgi:hypothetical protein
MLIDLILISIHLKGRFVIGPAVPLLVKRRQGGEILMVRQKEIIEIADIYKTF